MRRPYGKRELPPNFFWKRKNLGKTILKEPFKIKDRSLKTKMGSGGGTRRKGVRHPTASDLSIMQKF